VVITIPQAEPRKTPQRTPSPSPEATPEAESGSAVTPAEPANERVAENRPRFAGGAETVSTRIKPCKITFNEESIDLQTGGGEMAIVIGRDDDAELGDISAVSSSPADVFVRRQPIAGMKRRALFILRPVGERTGVFQVTFEMACAKRDLIVRVR
jgi:hypothetical protein